MLFLLGLAVGRARTSTDMQAQSNRMTEEMGSHEIEMRQLVRSAERHRAEKKIFNDFMLHMEQFARGINTELDRKKLGWLLLKTVENLFGATHILIYFTDPDGETLRPVATKGNFGQDISRHFARRGEKGGRVGHVAETQVTTSRDDFSSKSPHEQANFDNDPIGARLDLLAPMTRDEEPVIGKSTTIGVICIGGIDRSTYEQSKRMLKMVADLGSMGLQNALRFKEIRSSANHDGLTGLINKRCFMDRFSEAINAREGIPGRQLSVFLFDIDHFKSYNDGNGHLAGDEVLRTTGQLLQEFNAAHPGFLIGRYGGEEFVVVMPDTGREDASAAAEAIRRLIQEHKYPNEEKQPKGDLTISGGVAVFPRDGTRTTELLKCADEALYQAKSHDRNKVEVFDRAFLGGAEQETIYEHR